jgi:hypothetical protein
MVTVNPLIVPLAVTTKALSTTVAVLLVVALAEFVPEMPKLVDEEATVMVAVLLVDDAHAPLVTTAL